MIAREQLQPPFFVVDGVDVMFCRSLEELECFVEPIDAPDTVAYDATGRIVALRAVAGRPRARNWINDGLPPPETTQASPTSSRDPAALEQALRRFLGRIDPTVHRLSLEQIVRTLDRYGIDYAGERK